MNKSNLKEATTHGTILFPFMIHKVEFTNPLINTPLHWHQEFEIVYFMEGNHFVQIDDSKPIVTKPGQIIFINSGSLHSIHSSNKSPCMFYAIVFDMNLINSCIFDICQNNYINPILHNQCNFPQILEVKYEWQKQILNQVLIMIQVFNNKLPSYELAIKASLFNILYFLISNNELEIKINHPQGKTDRIKQILEYLQENYKAKVDISNVSAYVGLNKDYLCRIFKEYTGQTLIEYLNHYRIECAAKLLAEGKHKIINVAFEVGFDNVSYFIKTFKKYKKCTPSQYGSNVR